MKTMKHLLASLFCALLTTAATAQESGFNLIVVGDIQPQKEWQLDTLKQEIIPAIASIVEEYRATNYPTAILLTGDVAWDNMAYLHEVKTLFEALNVPVHAVIGNHDHNRYNSRREFLSESDYEAVWGSRYYAFELGETLFIGLDNIRYMGYENYKYKISNEQFRWLKKIVSEQPRDKHIAIAMHAPAANFKTEKPRAYIRKVLRLLRGHDIDLITGHRHRHATIDYAPNIIEHNVAQVNGNLWFAPICTDGTPRGVFCIEERNGVWQWQHRLLGHDTDTQLILWQEGEVNDHEEYLVVKVIGWDKRWRIEWSENGEKRGTMEQIEILDPDYMNYIDNTANYEPIIMQRLRRSTEPHRHYFRCKRSIENSHITITATDRFGRIYTLEEGR